jgi:integrase/recombinase XerD
MESKHTFSIDTILRRTRQNKCLGYLFMRVTVDAMEVEISTKEKINYAEWNSKTEQVTGRSIQSKAINDHLLNMKFRIRDHYRNLIDQQIQVTPQLVKEAYLGVQIKPKGHTVLELMAFHKKIMEPKLKQGTVKNYAATEAYWKNFILYKYKSKDVPLLQLDYQFMVEFEHYIPGHSIKPNDPCQGNGVAKHIERVKKMMAWGKTLQWIKSNPFDGFTATRKKTHRKILQLQELVQLEQLILVHSSLQYVRDLFLFSCYTGLAFADVMALKAEHIQHNGRRSILLIHREKSEELSAVPIFDAAHLIMQKYENDQRSLKACKIFPPISNQEVNRNIKILVAAAGILKPITFHSARHTFATTVTLKSGVPIESISLMLGHKKITTTQIYAQVDEEKLQEDMHGVEAKVRERKKLLQNK